MNSKISTDIERRIIGDFAKEIKAKAEKGANPEKAVIEFRNDRQRGKAGERDVYLVPVNILRFRKDNGRIASDITSYEKQYGILDETKESTQEIISQTKKGTTCDESLLSSPLISIGRTAARGSPRVSPVDAAVMGLPTP
ncbi:MAG: hypothetical protein EOP04_27070 [Proteobacteria bacterium]|nr:MAG: hypothetical protein EOP04_27070 [Pseudomonadota bacterium]